ncbi:hypothetical protein ACWGSK_14380 [Nocardiopsis sp. NPDC055551]
MTSPRSSPARECLLLGVCAMMSGQFSMMLRMVLTDHHPLHDPGVASIVMSGLLVLLMITVLFVLAGPALPRPFREPEDPPPPAPSTPRIMTWISWVMVVVPALMLGSELRHLPALWPLALFSVAGLVFALLCTRVHRRERARIFEAKERTR